MIEDIFAEELGNHKGMDDKERLVLLGLTYVSPLTYVASDKTSIGLWL